MEMIFHCRGNKSHFHKKGCALGLILKVRVSGTRKWPIKKTTSGILFHKSHKKKNLAVKYITVLPLLNTKKKKTSSFTENSLGPLTCKASDNLNFYNTDTCVMRILGSVPFGVPFKRFD